MNWHSLLEVTLFTSIKLQSPNFPDTSSLSYLTTKGYMYPALGNQWNMQYDLSTITWNAPRAPDSSCQTSLVAGLEYEIAHLPEVAAPGDFYWFGGHVGMVSRLAWVVFRGYGLRNGAEGYGQNYRGGHE